MEELMNRYEMVLNVLKLDLDILFKDYVYKNNYDPVNHIEYRIKSFDSSKEKLTRKGYDYSPENLLNHVHDMVGIRIICNFLTEVDDVISIIESSKQLRIIERKDYIKNPKDTGYTSYHLIVEVPLYLSDGIIYYPAEIQIRTLAMNFWASLDHKIQYKFDGVIPEEVKKEMYDVSMNVQMLDKKMIKLNDIVNRY